jgi:hypothetical protein
MRVHRTTLLDMSAIGSDLPPFEGLRMAFWIGAGGVFKVFSHWENGSLCAFATHPMPKLRETSPSVSQ